MAIYPLCAINNNEDAVDNKAGKAAAPVAANVHQLDPRIKTMTDIYKLLSCADVISIHVPLTEKTKGFIGKDQLSMMKRGCIIMNYARNGIVDEQSLLESLNQGYIKAYITDFPTSLLINAFAESRTDIEIPRGSLLFSPHLGASTSEAEENCAIMACRQLKDFLELGVVINSVNFPELDTEVSPTVKIRLSVVNNDVPNMIAGITSVLGQAGLNIHNFANKSNGTVGYNLIDFEADVDDDVVEAIRKIPNVLRVRRISIQ